MSSHHISGQPFVICPIGEEDSDSRKRANQLLTHLVEPALRDNEMETPLRADHIAESGLVNLQIIRLLFSAPLVIADLTNLNPNVFYELAVRQAFHLPFIQMIEDGESIPFDLADMRTIKYVLNDPDRLEAAKTQLRDQIDAVGQPGYSVDSPISRPQPLSRLLGQATRHRRRLERSGKTSRL